MRLCCKDVDLCTKIKLFCIVLLPNANITSVGLALDLLIDFMLALSGILYLLSDLGTSSRQKCTCYYLFVHSIAIVRYLRRPVLFSAPLLETSARSQLLV